MCQSWTQVFMDITDIDLFAQIVDLVCAKVRLRCSWISVVLIYLIKMLVWHVPESRLRFSWISLVLIYLI